MTLEEMKTAAVVKHGELVKPWQAAEKALNEQQAVVARLALLGIAEQHPTIARFTFDTESEYNDEGGYYTVVTANALDSEDDDVGQLSDELYDDLSDAAHQWINEEVLAILGHEEITVAQLREQVASG